MLELKNITKTYTSTKKNKVEALSNVNLSFDTKGIIFVLGPSGSGKSTLLNLLGGIDTPTSGDIIINGNKLKSDNSSLDEYRNNYISFIFQDFNLLPDLTVYENIGLLYGEMNSKKAKEEIDDILTEVNLSGYGDRYPNELSGGEIQRVAIARAIAKDSAIILADEPTGNLNKENSKKVCEILKRISLKKLVIVVSHNENLAKEYADRIIKIEDGKVIENVTINNIESEDALLISRKHKISKKNILKLSLKNVFKKKIRFIIMMLSIVVAFTILSLSLTISGYERPYIDAKNIMTNNVERYFFVPKEANLIMRNSDVETIIGYEDFKYIRNGVIESITEVIDMGYKLYPVYQEITDESIVISDNELYNNCVYNELYYIKDDSNVSKDDFDFDRIKEYYIKTVGSKRYIAGVYHSYRYNNSNPKTKKEGTEEYDKINEKSEYISFHTKKCAYFYKSSTSIPLGDYESGFSFYVRQNKKTNEIDLGRTIPLNTKVHDSYITDTEYVKRGSGVSPKTGEIYLSLELYNSFFNEKSDGKYYLGDDYNNPKLIRKPTHINERIDLVLIENCKNPKEFVVKDLIVKGIIVEPHDKGVKDFNCGMYVSKELYDEICDFTMDNNLLINASSVKDQYAFLKKVYNNYKFSPRYYFTQRIEKFEVHIPLAKLISNILIILMVALIVLLSTMIISQMVKSKDKENGILRAIGIKKRFILNIYLLQNIFIIFISFVISIIAAIAFVKISNSLLIGDYSKTAQLLVFRYQYALIIMGITIITNITINYIALHKAISKNPIDVIRQR